MLNSLHELTFSTTADSVEAGYIREDYYAVVKVEGQYREFIIDSIVESDDSELIKEVKASLSSIELNDTLLENKVTGSDPRLLLTSILSATRWSVGTVETGIYNRNFTEDVQFMTALEAIHTLAEFYNCDIHFSYVIDGNKVVRRSVNLFVRLGSSDGKRFEIDKDITSIEREIDTTALKTAIYPVMKTEDDDGKTVLTTIANVAWSKAAGDPVDKPLGQKYVGDPVALQNWGRLDKNGNLRHRMKLYEFTEEVTVAQMLSMSWVNLAKYTSPKITYTVNVLDLYSLLGEDYLHEKVVIGDTVTIIDRYFAVPIEISDRVIEIERDLLDPSNTVVTVGTESKSYTSDRGGREQATNEKIDAVNKNAVVAQQSADGKNTIYYGSLEPTKPNTGDTWFRPNPAIPAEEQMLIWTGSIWTNPFLGGDNIADNAITGTKIANATIGSAKIINIDASKVTANTLSAITTRTGALEVTGWLDFTTENRGLRGSYDFGDTYGGAYDARWFDGSFRLSHRHFVFTGNNYEVNPNNTKGRHLGYSESYQGQDYLKFRTWNYDGGTMYGRVDITSTYINMSNRYDTTNINFDSTNGNGYFRGLLSVNDVTVGTGGNLQVYDVNAHSSASNIYFNSRRGDVADFRIGVDGVGKVIQSYAAYARTYSSASNMFITDSGSIGRSISARKYKADIQAEYLTKSKKVLQINPSSWYDKVELANGKATKRYYGFIADEFHELGLTEVVQYGSDGQVEGLAYDRISMYHNVILQDHEQQLATVTQQLNSVANDRLQQTLLLESRLLSLQKTVVQLQQEIEQLRTA